MEITSYLLGKKAGGGTPAVLEEKEVSITTNGETTITPSEGYTGISSVEVITAVPQPSGKIQITQNGTDIDVSSYATADVNVGGGKFVFAGNKGGFNFQSVGLTQNEAHTVITDIIDKIDTSSISKMNTVFSSNPLMTNLDFTGFDTSNVTVFAYMFYNDTGLTSLNLSTFTNKTNNGDINCTQMFYGCSSLQHLDMRSFDFTKLTTRDNYSTMFGNTMNSGSTIPANCEIIVKDATQKAWFTNNTFQNINRLTNVKTVAEYEGS